VRSTEMVLRCVSGYPAPRIVRGTPRISEGHSKIRGSSIEYET